MKHDTGRSGLALGQVEGSPFPQHPDEHSSQHTVLLAVDRELGFASVHSQERSRTGIMRVGDTGR